MPNNGIDSTSSIGEINAGPRTRLLLNSKTSIIRLDNWNLEACIGSSPSSVLGMMQVDDTRRRMSAGGEPQETELLRNVWDRSAVSEACGAVNKMGSNSETKVVAPQKT